MKLQKIIFVQLLALASACYASDPATLERKRQSLVSAQSALSLALGQGPELPLPANMQAFTYKNSTSIPIIISLAANDGVIARQQIAPSATYTQNFIPTSQVAIEVHANLSPMYAIFTQAAAYALTINAQADLELNKTAETGSVIVNNSGWPMIISFGYKNNDSDETTLGIGQRYTPPAGSINITVIPMINDIGNPAAVVKSCTVANNNGQLALQF